MKRKINKRGAFLLIIYIGMVLILGGFDLVHKTSFLHWTATVIVVVLGGILIYNMVSFSQSKWTKSGLATRLFGGIILLSILVPIAVHLLFFSEAKLNESDFLSFYGDYLGFLGAFVLGYAVYQRDGQIRREAKIKDAKMLYACLDSVIEQIHIVKDGRKRTGRIEYDSQWSLYYHEIASIQFEHETDMRGKIEYIFKTVE